MPEVTVADLSALAGRQFTAEQGGAALSVVRAAVKAYVRGGPSWVPNDEQASVIKTGALRLLFNPSQLDHAESLGPEAASWRGGFDGFTLGERITLDRYRIQAV